MFFLDTQIRAILYNMQHVWLTPLQIIRASIKLVDFDMIGAAPYLLSVSALRQYKKQTPHIGRLYNKKIVRAIKLNTVWSVITPVLDLQ